MLRAKAAPSPCPCPCTFLGLFFLPLSPELGDPDRNVQLEPLNSVLTVCRTRMRVVVGKVRTAEELEDPQTLQKSQG